MRAGRRALPGHRARPFGRFAPTAIYPLEDAWARHDRSVSCGIDVWPPDGSDGRSAEDARTAPQAFVYDTGACIAGGTTGLDGVSRVVGCDQSDEQEVTGRVSFDDLPAPPSRDQVAARCTPVSESYLGGSPVPPWDFGYEVLARESWDAGTRAVHCFVAQWDDDGNLLEVRGSATG